MILLCVIVAVVLNLEPDSTTATTHRLGVAERLNTIQSASVEDDDTIHFPKYKGTARDPFIPAVVFDNPTVGGPGSLVNGSKWELTGINSVNGVVSALIENPETNESVFLQQGDSWHGLRVASISDDSINFVNALGQVTQMGFADQAPANSSQTIGAANTPSVNQITPLPPLNPNDGTQTQPFNAFRRNRRLQSDDQESLN